MSSAKIPKGLADSSLSRVHLALSVNSPQVYSFLTDLEDFLALRIYAKDDGTFLAVAKGVGPDGGTMVCFGAGYDPISCLMSIEGTLAADNWKVDSPMPSRKE